MRGKDFFKGLNHVEDEMITEMETPVPVKKFNRNYLKFAAVAACIAVLTGAVAVSALEKNGTNMNKSSGGAGDLHETTQGEKESETVSTVGEEETTSSSMQTQGGTGVLAILLKEDTLTAEGAVFVIKNEMDEACTSGEYYRIEKLEKDIWVPLEYVREDVSWIEIGWEIGSYSEWEFTADWKDIYGTLDSGRYRLMKAVNGEGIFCEFEIGA